MIPFVCVHAHAAIDPSVHLCAILLAALKVIALLADSVECVGAQVKCSPVFISGETAGVSLTAGLS